MAKYRVRVNPKFKGELMLPSVNYSVKGGTLLVLDEEQFNGQDVQVALKREFLLNDDEKNVKQSVEKNKGKKIDASVEKEQKPRLSAIEKQLESSNVADEVPEDDGAEEKVRVVDPTSQEEKTTPTVWDAYEKKAIDQKEGMKKALAQLNSIQMQLQQGEIDFDNKKKSKTNKKSTKAKAKKTNKTAKKDKAKKDVTDTKVVQTLPLPQLDGSVEEQLSVDDNVKVIKKSKTIKRLSNNDEIE